MSREFMIVIERDEEGYLVGSVPALKVCHTQHGQWMTSFSESEKP